MFDFGELSVGLFGFVLIWYGCLLWVSLFVGDCFLFCFLVWVVLG